MPLYWCQFMMFTRDFKNGVWLSGAGEIDGRGMGGVDGCGRGGVDGCGRGGVDGRGMGVGGCGREE